MARWLQVVCWFEGSSSTSLMPQCRMLRRGGGGISQHIHTYTHTHTHTQRERPITSTHTQQIKQARDKRQDKVPPSGRWQVARDTYATSRSAAEIDREWCAGREKEEEKRIMII